MIDPGSLVTALKAQVLALEDDLRVRLEVLPETKAEWQDEHRRLIEVERTASAWVAWRDDRITQAAVAWVLTTVFIRFCEDNALLRPVWIAGPRSRRQEALDAQLAYFRQHPDDSDREWLGEAIAYLRGRPATAGLVDAHCALWLVSPSGQAASALLAFWRRRDEQGELIFDFTDPDLSTRFLGDLYQDLSDHAKKTYALLQTPEFVEEFILDQTMEPALAERPLEGFLLIDPTCGSGHFLLGAFRRLLTRWDRQAPSLELQERVELALNSINGVDLNPFAVAIARFRLTVAALQACGLSSLEHAPNFRYHVATGDSLLFGGPNLTLPIEGADPDLAASRMSYATEDVEQLREILQPGRYDVVVGNPPYPPVKDKTLRARYRELYSACKGTYALTVPFMQRFFELAKPNAGDHPAGWVGQITSNSFMKREFGSKLIEEVLVSQDLRLVVDTAGAFIPGHGTPTAIIVGRHQQPVGPTIRAVQGIRNEPGRPESPERGQVWTAIVEGVDLPGYVDSWVSVSDSPRESWMSHPWSLSGGGASDLLRKINSSTSTTLKKRAYRIGFYGDSHADEVFMEKSWYVRRHLAPASDWFFPSVRGEDVRDWGAEGVDSAFLPYEARNLVSSDRLGSALNFLWRVRTVLTERSTFSGGTYRSDGRPWYAWHQLPKDFGSHPWALSWAEITTHNHFALDCGSTVFNRSAPVIKLPGDASEDDHLGLLALLNSSLASFWLKQNCFNKGRPGAEAAGADEPWEHRYQFAGTALGGFPVSDDISISLSRSLHDSARELAEHSPRAVCESGVPTSELMSVASQRWDEIRRRMVALQEELDWQVYKDYRLIDEALVTSDPPDLDPAERAFAILLARQVETGQETSWFDHWNHRYAPITEIPAHWTAEYRALVQRRLDLIDSDPNIRLLENPDHKRRWASEPWETKREVELRGWLLDRLEEGDFWFEHGRPGSKSVGELADMVARDVDLVSVLALWEGRPDVPLVKSLTKLVTAAAVPYLAAYRLKDSGLRKFESWQDTWACQRREDAGEEIGPNQAPPQYANKDFKNDAWWQIRGKLDLPRERFILYPDAGRSTDQTLLLGWAGWDHAQQSLALATIIGEREEEGWDDVRLIPLVAGLAELQPWVEQWHADLDPTYGISLATFCREQLAERSRQVGRSVEELSAWRPAAATRGRKARA